MATSLTINDSGSIVQVAELALLTGKQQLVVGDLARDLILRTSGNIQIQVGTRFYPLNYNTTSTSTSTTTGTSTTLVVDSNTTILTNDSDLTTLTYPGDGNYVFITQSKSFYVASAGAYVRLNPATTVDSSGNVQTILYLSYNNTQTLTGAQKLQVILNSGSINSFLDIASYTKDSVYANMLIYSIADKNHYVLADVANPSLQASWKPIYLSLTTGGTSAGPITVDFTGKQYAYSAFHIEGQPTLLDAHGVKANTQMLTIGSADYTSGVAVWSNGMTYLQNLYASTTSGFKFLTTKSDGTQANPLNVYSSGIGLFGEPNAQFNLTMYGKSLFTDFAYLNNGIGSQDYSTMNAGYTLSKDSSNLWLLEVDRLIVRNEVASQSDFTSKSIDGSFWSNPSIKVSSFDILGDINVYALASSVGNYTYDGTSYTLRSLSDKPAYAMVDASTDYSDPSSARNVVLMELAFCNGDRDGSGVTDTVTTYVYDGVSTYSTIPGSYSFDGTQYNPDVSGTYVLRDVINVIYIETDSLSMLSVEDILYYATWNPDGTEDRTVVGRVDSINDTGAIIHVYGSETVTTNQELVLIARSTSNNGLHLNGIDPNGDYLEHLVDASSARDLFENFYYSIEGDEILPRNTYKPTTSVTSAKLGALDNLVDSTLGLTGTPQFGLYSSNAYLAGNFVLNAATFNNIPVVTGTYQPFIMLDGTQLQQIDMSTEISHWDTAYSWGNHALAGYAYKTVTIDASGSGLTGGGDLSANRTFSLDYTYLNTLYEPLIQKLTTSAKTALVSPTVSTMVYDTTLNKLCVFTGTVWETVTSS
jgi:hypothetical protein